MADWNGLSCANVRLVLGLGIDFVNAATDPCSSLANPAASETSSSQAAVTRTSTTNPVPLLPMLPFVAFDDFLHQIVPPSRLESLTVC
jgi:hypothetical protein